MTSSRIFRPVSGPNPARKNSAKNAPVLCQIRHAPGHSSFSFCVKKGRQNGPYSQLHFCGFKPSHALSIPAYRLHIADISPTRSSPTAILIYPAPLYSYGKTCPARLMPRFSPRGPNLKVPFGSSRNGWTNAFPQRLWAWRVKHGFRTGGPFFCMHARLLSLRIILYRRWSARLTKIPRSPSPTRMPHPMDAA